MKFLNPFFHMIFVNFFSCVSIRMSKTLSAKYYQEKKERLKESLQKISKFLQKRNRKKVAIWSKTLQKSLKR